MNDNIKCVVYFSDFNEKECKNTTGTSSVEQVHSQYNVYSVEQVHSQYNVYSVEQVHSIGFHLHLIDDRMIRCVRAGVCVCKNHVYRQGAPQSLKRFTLESNREPEVDISNALRPSLYFRQDLQNTSHACFAMHLLIRYKHIIHWIN